MFHFNLASLRQLALSRWIAGIVLLSALQTTFMLWMSEREHAEALQTMKFRQSVTAAEEAIQHKMDTYRQILKGVEQLYLSSTHVSADEFKRFVSDYTENPEDGSLSALGFIKYINLHQPLTLTDLDMPVQQLLEKVHTAKNDHELAVLLYVEPRTGANTEQLFQNAFQNTKRRADLIESGEDERLVMSAPGFQQLGLHRKEYILQVPVYLQGQTEGNHMLHLLNGWVFLSFDVHAFLRDVLAPVEKRALHFDIFDMVSGEVKTALYRTQAWSETTVKHQAAYVANHTLNVNGQVWNIRVRSSRKFDSGIDYSEANRLGMMGIFLSVLLSTLVYFAVLRNRTQIVLEKYNQELNTAEQRWKFALESTGDGLWDWYVPDSRVVYSDRWKSMLGFAPHQLDNNPSSWHERIHPDDAVGVMSVLDDLLHGGRQDFSLEYRLKCRDGSWKWVMDRGVVFKRDADGLPLRVLGMLTDITKIKQSEETVWQYANVDTLTGLLNRRRFFIKLDQALVYARQHNHKLAIIFMDLDRFKEVNDTLGHAQGDKLLQDAGQRLQGCVGPEDIVSRLGGDEFVIMLNDADARYVEDIAQKVLYQLSYPFMLDHTHAYISASLGISIFPDDADNKDDLMKRVDQAMYASKHKGGNCFTYFTPRMQAQAEHKMALSNDLRQAISDEQFFLEYQPVVNLKTHRVIKAEALVRWQHPLKGIIPPVEFVSIAEDNLLIIPIGQWVFETAIAQCSQWRERLEPDFQVAINKSPIQFASEHRKHHDWLFKMAQNQLHKGMVVVEITERLLMEANPQVSERLAQYRQAGVQVALDDFGTGYSSLSYLKKFPIDYVKIDRAFVRELSVSHEDQALCQAIIVMAHSLGMQVIAEGIESRHQLDLLCKMGCDYGQGYYFSPPLRPEAFEEWYRQWGRQVRKAPSKPLS